MKSIVIFIKYPAPGKVKTRLGAEIGAELAARVYRLFLGLTFDLARGSSAQQLLVACEPAARLAEFHHIIPPAFTPFPQRGDDLGRRMHHAFEYAFSHDAQQVLILGSDTPTLPTPFLDDAFARLQECDLVLGPAEDGGYYLIGLKTSKPELFVNIKWSSDTVLQTTLQRARELKLSHYLLPTWYDVDDLKTLRRAARDDASGRIQSYLQTYSTIL
jgi:hypothetical protein